MPIRAYFLEAIRELEESPGTTQMTITHDAEGLWTVSMARESRPYVTHSGPSLLDALSSAVENFDILPKKAKPNS